MFTCASVSCGSKETSEMTRSSALHSWLSSWWKNLLLSALKSPDNYHPISVVVVNHLFRHQIYGDVLVRGMRETQPEERNCHHQSITQSIDHHWILPAMEPWISSIKKNVTPPNAQVRSLGSSQVSWRTTVVSDVERKGLEACSWPLRLNNVVVHE